MVLNLIRQAREEGKERIEGGEDMNSFEEALIAGLLENVQKELRERAIKSEDGRVLEAGFVTSYFLKNMKDVEKIARIKNMLKNNVSLDDLIKECLDYRSAKEKTRERRLGIIKRVAAGLLITFGVATGAEVYRNLSGIQARVAYIHKLNHKISGLEQKTRQNEVYLSGIEKQLASEREALRFVKNMIAEAEENKPGLYERLVEIEKTIKSKERELSSLEEKLKEKQAEIEAGKKAFEKIDVGKSKEIQDAYNLAGTYNKEGKYREAERLLQGVIELNPENALAHNLLGIVCLNQRNYDKAKACYEKAIALNPKEAIFYHNLGVFYGAIGKGEKEIEYYEKAINIAPWFPLTYNNLGYTYIEKDKQKALKYFRNYLSMQGEKEPSRVEMIKEEVKKLEELIELERQLEVEKQDPKDVRVWQRMIELNSNNYLAYNFLGESYLAERQYEEAKSLFEKALLLNPSAEIYSNLGTCLSRIGEDEKAREYCQKAIELNPTLSLPYYNLGHIIYPDDAKQALEYFKKYLELEDNKERRSQVETLVRNVEDRLAN